MRALQKQGKHEVRTIYVDDWMNKDKEKEAQEFEEWSDIIVIQRLLVSEILTKVATLRFARNKPVVIDLDDGYHVIPRSLASYKFWKEGKVQVPGNKEIRLKYTPLEQLTWGVKLCSALTSPSSVILDDWKDCIERRYLVPNYIETERYIPHRNVVHDSKWITIGWGGSGSHEESFTQSKVIPAIRRVLAERSNVRFLIAGGINYIAKQISHPSFKAGKIVTVPWSPYDQWPVTLSNIDIGLVPLSGAYDERRSPIKVLEFGIMGIPWVGIENPVTQPFHYQGRLVRANTAEWVDAILDYVDNIDRERGKAIANMAWAEQQDINLNVDEIAGVYEQIITTEKESV